MNIRKNAETGVYEEIPWSEMEKTPEATLAQKQLLMQGYAYNPDGTLRAATEEEMLAGMTETEKGQYNITKQTAERTQKALAGTLEIPQAVQSKLDEQQKIQEEQLARMYGPNWAASTAGTNLKTKQEEQRASVRSGVAQGALDSSGALNQINTNITNSLSNQTGNLYGQNYGASANQYNQMVGYPGRTSGLIDVYGKMGARDQQERLNRYIAEMQGKANSSSIWSSLIGAGGQMGAAKLGDTGDQRFKFNSAEEFFAYLDAIQDVR
jgi:hypothetical protein